MANVQCGVSVAGVEYVGILVDGQFVKVSKGPDATLTGAPNYLPVATTATGAWAPPNDSAGDISGMTPEEGKTFVEAEETVALGALRDGIAAMMGGGK